MRTFKEILNESQKTYEFTIKMAGELSKDNNDKLESCLQKYQLVKLGPGKTTPITERPLDFPQLQNMEVTYFEATVEYPTTQQMMQEYVGHCCNIPQSHIIVRNPNEPQEVYQEEKTDGPYEIKLTKEELESEDGQALAGTNRVMDLLKELEDARKDKEHDPIADTPAGESKDIDDKENTKAVL